MSDEKQKYDNFKTALGDGKTRTIFIGGLVILAVIAVIAYLSIKNSSTKDSTYSEVASIPVVQSSTNDSADGKSSTHVYDKLMQEENAKSAEDAAKNGSSAVPALRASSAQPEPQVQPQQQLPQPQQQSSPQSQSSNTQEEQERKKAYETQVTAMKNQVNLLITSWSPKDHVTFSSKEGSVNGAVVNPAQTQNSATGAQVQASVPTRKGGDTCYAVLDTAVNTDEPSPVTATIQQCGVLDQSKLIGKVDVAQNSQIAQKAQLRFSSINVPGQSTSLPIDAVAIDETTRRTALASDVDNHYFLRYGTLFASAFLSGYGDALIKGGQQEQVVTTTTGAIVQRQAYDTKQLALAGIGNVGKQISNNMGSVFNRPPTIKIDAGIGIGILFMNDLTLK